MDECTHCGGWGFRETNTNGVHNGETPHIVTCPLCDGTGKQ